MTLILEEVTRFLCIVPPFSLLDEKTLTAVARAVSIEYYPRGTTVLTDGGSPSEYLNVIKKGGVKVFILSDEGREVALDYRGEGECFGFISLIGADKSRSTVVTMDDTICYQLDRATVMGLMDSQPAFSEYFVRSFLIKSIDNTYDEMHRLRSGCSGGDRILFTTRLGELVTRKAVTRPQDITIADAAGVMAGENISSLILTGPDGSPAGIITDRDLRNKVIARGRDTGGPASEVMSPALVRVDADDYCFEALLKMVRYNIHHLAVIKGGSLAGVVTNHDFLLLQGSSPVSIVKDIESRQTIDELAASGEGALKLISLLAAEGARAGNITKIITEVNDRLVRRAIEIVLRKHGEPPVPFCWVALGSEGRQEQTFRTDQDNAIIYADPRSIVEADAADEYFAAFAADVSDALVRCGFSPCPAGLMASDPRWRMPLSGWKRQFKGWIYNPTPEAVLSSLIYFDFRPVFGESGLADRLRDSIAPMLADQEVFLGFMAKEIIRNRPPVGFLGSLVVEKSGLHKNELNLKVKGLAPVVDAVRLFALEKGIRETSTIERLAALRDVHSIAGEYADELVQAFEFIMLLRVHHQLEQAEAGLPQDNFINPAKLSGLQKKTLKEAFRLISEVQGTIIERYKPMIW